LVFRVGSFPAVRTFDLRCPISRPRKAVLNLRNGHLKRPLEIIPLGLERDTGKPLGILQEN
jgi:hypothetical protein